MRIIIIALLFFGPNEFYSAPNNISDNVQINIENDGSVTLKVEYVPIQASIDTINTQYALSIILIPFKNHLRWRFISADDVSVRLFSEGNGYTLLSIVYPRNKNKVVFGIENCTILKETREGKSQLEIDFSYEYLSEADKSILLYPFVSKAYNFFIVLPHEYEDTEISFYPSTVKKINKTKFSFVSTETFVEKFWIVFPNPIESDYNTATLILALLVGLFTVWFNVPAIRERKIQWAIAVFFLSLIIIVLAFYFSVNLTKGRDFFIWSAAAVPHVLFGFFASIYIAFANKLQCVIGGQIRIDGIPADFAQVILFGISGGKEIRIDNVDRLINGRYTFYVWVQAKYDKLLIKAKANNTDEKISDKFTISKKGKLEIQVLDLQRKNNE